MLEGPVTISKLDASGKRLTSYPGQVISDDGRVVAVRCRWTRPQTVELGPFTIESGDCLIEHYFRDQPFNVFTILGPSGKLKGWYCNVLAYTRIEARTIDWADLALDLLVTPTGDRLVLDEDEFEALHPTPDQRALAETALNTLNDWVDRHQWPFDCLAQGTVCAQ